MDRHYNTCLRAARPHRQAHQQAHFKHVSAIRMINPGSGTPGS